MSTFRGSCIPANPRKPTQFPRLHTSHERIPIFMIQEKDASTPCDERHVKYRRNTNVLTQKKTGGKRIMGNQGMTNWKLGMFIVIALTLVAGLFADTALAGNGDGTMIRSLTIPTDAVLIPDEEIVKAGTIDVAATDNDDEGLGLKFTYMADGADGASPIDMNGGTVRLKIHPDWKIGIDNIESVSDGTTGTTTLLYLRGAKLTDVA